MGDYEISRLNKCLRHVKFEVAMKMFVPVIGDTLNKNENIHLPHSFFSSKKSKAEYCYEQVKSAIETIDKNIKEKRTWMKFLNFQLILLKSCTLQQ